MTDTAKLREALALWDSAVWADDDHTTDEWREAYALFAETSRLLLESLDIILIRRDAEGTWPKKVRQTVASAIGQAASTERRGELTPEVFVQIQTRLLDQLAALPEPIPHDVGLIPTIPHLSSAPKPEREKSSG